MIIKDIKAINFTYLLCHGMIRADDGFCHLPFGRNTLIMKEEDGMGVKRIFVEKKPDFAVKAKELREEIESYLGIDCATNVRVLIRYDIENLSEEIYRKALVTIFSEPPVDLVYEEEFPADDGDRVFSVEYLPGQFDQRAAQ